MTSPTSEENTLNIAFLACDKVPEEAEEAHGDYADVIHNLFEPHMPDHIKLLTHNYDVVKKRHYPKEADLDRIDVIIISGSFEDDAHTDATWILRLAGFLIYVHDEFPRIRIVGICFGLQVIARAFGPSPIVENEKGWEVGSTKIQLTDLGRRVLYGDSLECDTKELRSDVIMQQIHSDIVQKCPDEFHLLGSSDITPVQAIAKFYDGPPPAFTHTKGGKSPDDFRQTIHMIAFQGHPEWHEDILIPLVDAYEEDGTYDREYAEEARSRVRKPHDGEEVGRVILKVLGIL